MKKLLLVGIAMFWVAIAAWVWPQNIVKEMEDLRRDPLLSNHGRAMRCLKSCGCSRRSILRCLGLRPTWKVNGSDLNQIAIYMYDGKVRKVRWLHLGRFVLEK